jgi:hypothetical protein
MKYLVSIASLTAFTFLVIAEAGCETNSMDASRYGLLMNHKVTVYMTGDVKHEEYVQIRRELSKASVYEAAGGWSGFSELGMEPKWIHIMRVENGVTNLWKVDFVDMGHGKWNHFLFKENDRIAVPMYYF